MEEASVLGEDIDLSAKDGPGLSVKRVAMSGSLYFWASLMDARGAGTVSKISNTGGNRAYAEWMLNPA